jgi:hypothetical protein
MMIELVTSHPHCKVVRNISQLRIPGNNVLSFPNLDPTVAAANSIMSLSTFSEDSTDMRLLIQLSNIM